MMEVRFDVAAMLAEIDAQAVRIKGAEAVPETYWLYYFRTALHGVASRLYGARLHYNALHSWWPRRLTHLDAEYHLANGVFNMDSAIECLVFAMNALGNVRAPEKFHDVTDEAALRKICPANILGPRTCIGYAELFPTLTSHWHANATLVSAVMEFHDVTKHRHAEAGSGKYRLDAPPGFYDGVPEHAKPLLAPYEQMIIGPDAKLPLPKGKRDWRIEQYATLEQVMADFKPFIELSLQHAVTDARSF